MTLLRLVPPLLILLVASASAQRVPPWLRPGRIVGSVTQQETGAPAVGATVSAIGTVLTATVLPDGTFMIDEVPAGTYDLTISGTLYRTVVREGIAVEPATSTVMNVVLGRERSLIDRRVVTPARRSQPIYESAAAVTVVDRTDAPFTAGHTTSRVLAQTAGLHLDGPHLSMRGSGGGVLPFGSRVALLVDGLPLVSPDFSAALPDVLPLSAIDHIEVVRGAAGVLYGSGSVAGVINLVTPRPVEEHRGNASLHTGVYTDAGAAEPGWWGSTPLRYSGGDVMWTRREKSLGVLLAGSFSSDDGFRQHEPSGGFSLFGRVNVWLPSGAEFRGTALVASGSRGAQSPWRGYDSSLFSLMPDSASASISTSFTTFALEYHGVESRSMSFTFRGYLQHGSTNPGRDTSQLPLSSGTRVGGEVQLTSFVNRRISFTYGAQAAFDVASSLSLTTSVSRSVAGWAQMELTNLYDIVTIVGARADLILYPGSSQPNDLQITPSVGVAYHPLPSTSLRASIGRGFRAPSIAERGLSTTVYGARIVPNPELRSEQSWQGELGGAFREAWGNVLLGLDVSLFVNEYFSMIEPQLDGSGAVAFVNGTRARILGAELGGDISVAEGLVRGALSVALIAARDLRREAPLRGRPGAVATANIDWNPKPLLVRILYRLVGAIDDVGPATRMLVPDAERTGTTSIVDLRLSLELADYIALPLAAHVDVRNLFGARGYDGIGAPAPIRNVEVGIGGRF